MPRRLDRIVSIPHWFSLNPYYHTKTISDHTVSIPHWFSLNLCWYTSHSPHSAVSIPHWFSLNTSRPRMATSWTTRFHPTLVLAQPNILRFSKSVNFAFPSHIGSRSTKRLTHYLVFQNTFPSHIGSRSTRRSRIQSRVSHSSFHPTLVLAQRETYKKKYC